MPALGRCRSTDEPYFSPRVFRTLQTRHWENARLWEAGVPYPKRNSYEKDCSSGFGNIAAAGRCVNHVVGRRRGSATYMLTERLREIRAARRTRRNSLKILVGCLVYEYSASAAHESLSAGTVSTVVRPTRATGCDRAGHGDPRPG